MKRLLPLAMLLGVTLFGAALLQRPKQSPRLSAPECGDPSTCGAEAPAPTEAIVAPTVPGARQGEMARPRGETDRPPEETDRPPVQPQAVAADAAALRAEADR